jgi:hypothetical protein
MDEPVENAASLLHPQPASLLPRKLKSKGANALLLFVLSSSLFYLSLFEPIDSTKDFALREGKRGSQRPFTLRFFIRYSLFAFYLSPFEPIDSTKDFALREGKRGSQRPFTLRFFIRYSLFAFYLSPFEPIDSTKDFALREGGNAASAREHSLLCDRGERGSQRPRSVKDKVESTGRHFTRILNAAF